MNTRRVSDLMACALALCALLLGCAEEAQPTVDEADAFTGSFPSGPDPFDDDFGSPPPEPSPPSPGEDPPPGEETPDPGPNPAPDPAPAPRDYTLAFACGVVEDLDCSDPNDENSRRDCEDACEEMVDCITDLCSEDTASHYDDAAIDACVATCRAGGDFANPDDIEDLDCEEMQPGLCASISGLAGDCGCPGEPAPQPGPDPGPDPEPAPDPEPVPDPDPAPAVDCAAACEALITCLGQICEAGTLATIGGTVRGRCVETCTEDPARFAGRDPGVCAPVIAETCAEEPALGFVCDCP